MSQARKHRRRKAQRERREGRRVERAASLRAAGFFGMGVDDVLGPVAPFRGTTHSQHGN